MTRPLLHLHDPEGRVVPLVLASRSETRAEQLRSAGLAFTVVASGVDESGHEELEVGRRVIALAEEKARAVAAPGGSRVVVGCDTLVLHGGDGMGQPRDAAAATGMLRRLSGGAHEVVTGLCVLDERSGKVRSSAHSVTVRWRDVDGGFLDAYVASGRWRGKAGAYDLLGLGSVLVEEVAGDPSVVLGLPMGPLFDHCGELGLTVGVPEQDPGGS